MKLGIFCKVCNRRKIPKVGYVVNLQEGVQCCDCKSFIFSILPAEKPESEPADTLNDKTSTTIDDYYGRGTPMLSRGGLPHTHHDYLGCD